ncbi:unnamed protein product [Phyllotreta striolata]|uniref:THAP-type domain-containing protein n=1 Tax=Phyllotreta striolata TaxID=444603 RepID=A0A9N9TL99_PHYSR|nr:unnamed protein product [Phyllotreta striolata]
MNTSKRVLVCSVPECTNTQAKRHFIPKKYERIRKIWLQRINNPIFVDKPSSYITAKAVCDIHFEEICKRDDHKLKNYSLPSLFVPGFAGVDDEKERFFSFPPNPYEMKGTPPKVKRLLDSFKNEMRKRRKPLDIEEAEPSHEVIIHQQTLDIEEAGPSYPLQTAGN